MVSVPLDTAITSSGQPAPPKPAKAERSPAPDSFASLIGDSAADAANNDRASAARDKLVLRRTEDARSYNRTPRDPSSFHAPARARAADDDANAARSGRADASTDAADTSKPATTGEVKPTDATPDIKASETSDTRNAADQTGSSAVNALAVAASTAVAVAIPVTVASIGISGGSTPSVGVQAPLAIASAALVNSSAINGPQSGPELSANPIPDAGAALSESETVADENKAGGSGIDALGNAGKADAAAATQPAKSVSNPDAIEQQTAAAAAVAPSTLKTGFNATGATRPGLGASANPAGLRAVSDSSETSLPSTDKTATTERSSPDGKSDAPSAIVAAKPEPSNASAAIQLLGASHEHTAASTTASAQADQTESGIQAASSFQQPHLNVIAADQPSVTVSTSAVAPLNALALQIAATAQSGKSRFEIRLDPAELGRIDVRIDIDRQGQMTSHLTVEKPETLAMLRQDAPQLQRALDDAGFKTGNGGLQFSLRDQSSSGQNSGNESGHHGPRLIISNEETISATTAGRTYGRMLASSGGVDIRV